ncbi:hypothetical protein [Luteolibacter sp. LG18]|uniref:hypothetical protein n=1 Tax=Luteolibacter sp. LG18 TaxID=2819286 RepID=UPI002B2B8570|nr:hypothetical protein llg_07850 [Luteolibacter sp. LG18]
MTKSVVGLLAWLILPGVGWAKEGWWLEMDAKYADALLARHEAGNPAGWKEAVAKLPQLIQSGAIREIEKVGVAQSETGGPKFPRKKIKLEKGQEASTGSSYHVEGAATRTFQIRGPLPAFNVLGITTTGKLSKEWTPVFLLRKGAVLRLLLERDPASAEEVSTSAGRLTFKVEPVLGSEFTWFLTPEQRQWLETGKPPAGLPAGPEEGKSRLFAFSDSADSGDMPEGGLRGMGVDLGWSLDPQGAVGYDFSRKVLKAKSKDAYELLMARAKVAPGTREGKSALQQNEEKVTTFGTASDEGKEVGEVVWSLSAPSPAKAGP